MYFNGVNDYIVIPLVVYGWPGITIQEWIYPFHPKANSDWTKFNMIGDYWTDRPSTFFGTDNRYDYTSLAAVFVTRRSDGSAGWYPFSIFEYRNTWVNVVRRFDLSSRTFTGFVNSNRIYTVSISPTEYTILEWNPNTATYPQRYKQFVLGANVYSFENMKMIQGNILIYSRALSDSEIRWNYLYSDNPVRNGLVLWLQADPQYVKDIDGDNILEWIDLSGYNNHGKIYGAQLVQLIKTSVRALKPVRVLKPAR